MVQPLMEDTKKRVMSLQEIKKGGYGEKDEINDIIFVVHIKRK
jgi:hypothetical protein